MKTRPAALFFYMLGMIPIFSGCMKEIIEPSIESFQARSYISTARSFDTDAIYKTATLPVDTLSDNIPFVTIQSWVVKGKDILVSITVPSDASELYIGASNSSTEYMGLSFSDDYQTIPFGYYQLNLSTLKATKAEANGYKNYHVVLSTLEDIEVEKFDLVASYKSSGGNSNLSSKTLDVKNIAPYQESLRVGFQPLSGYSYSIQISTPSGQTVNFSSNNGTEVFDNSQAPGTSLSYSSDLGFNWIDFADPEFGSYTLSATIEINISGGSQYIELYLAVITEGRIEQVDLDADIQQTGQNTAVGTVELGFGYFSMYKFFYEVPGIIPAIAQPTDWTCWATVTTMLVSWKNNISYSIESVMAMAGAYWLNKFNNNDGISSEEKNQFLADIGLTGEPNMNYSVEGFYSLLIDFGPLWVTTNEGSSQHWAFHARIVTGLYGDGSADNTFLHIIDPATGSKKYESYKDFVRKFESVATTPFTGLQIVHF